MLIQRGRGGGLAGAFGGMGGQSAFGTKAGDLFTRVTIGVAAFWIMLCICQLKVMRRTIESVRPDRGRVPTQDFLPPDRGADRSTPAARQLEGNRQQRGNRR